MDKIKQELDKNISIRNVMQVFIIALIGFIWGSIATLIIAYQVIEKMLNV